MKLKQIEITEVSVNVHLLDSRIGGSTGRHGTVGSFIRIKGIIQFIHFFKCFQLFAGCRWNFIKVDGFIEHGKEQRLIKEITGKENISENI